MLVCFFTGGNIQIGVKTFKCGDIIFRQGDSGDCMYDIQSGQVDIYVDFGGTNEKKIAQLKNGELFGEMGILDDSPPAPLLLLFSMTVRFSERSGKTI